MWSVYFGEEKLYRYTLFFIRMVFFHFKMNIISFLTEIIHYILRYILTAIPNFSYPGTKDRTKDRDAFLAK